MSKGLEIFWKWMKDNFLGAYKELYQQGDEFIVLRVEGFKRRFVVDNGCEWVDGDGIDVGKWQRYNPKCLVGWEFVEAGPHDYDAVIDWLGERL